MAVRALVGATLETDQVAPGINPVTAKEGDIRAAEDGIAWERFLGELPERLGRTKLRPPDHLEYVRLELRRIPRGPRSSVY